MIKILSNAQTREFDAYTIKNTPIASIDLMERACTAFADWFIKKFNPSKKVVVVCGTGNNGGDGLGIARLLANQNYNVHVVIVRSSSKETTDFNTNLYRLPKKIEVSIITNSSEIDFANSEIIIDAILGSGLSRPVDGLLEQVISKLNEKKSIRVAVDIPSGLFSDKHSIGACIKADYTITIQLPKLSFFFPENHDVVGEWMVVDIGLSQDYINQCATDYYLLDEESIRKIIKPRKKFSHKGDFGHSLIIAGSFGKIGANVLATRAALRTGSGLVTSYLPMCGYSVIQSAAPEAMALTDPHEQIITNIPDVKKFNAIGIGPGLGTAKETARTVNELFDYCRQPLIIDADALNILAEHNHLQRLIPQNSILTPHRGEFRRLVGQWQNDFECLELQRKLSKRLQSIIILKGAYTSISLPDGRVYFNSTGNPAMATGGSGDVLTGILTSLLAQGYTSEQAALLGVYIHGLAGDLAAKEKPIIIASDIIEQISEAFKRLQ